jgi:hypothetical protein
VVAQRRGGQIEVVERRLQRVVVEGAAGAAHEGVEDVDRTLHVLEHVGGECAHVVFGDLTGAGLDRVLRGEQGNLSTAAKADRSAGAFSFLPSSSARS